MTQLELFRRKKGLTQTELAVAVGITQKSISFLENGIDKVSFGTLYRIKSYLKFEGEVRDLLSEVPNED
jgi:transcriptional regulator with XRE-family HTH domain